MQYQFPIFENLCPSWGEVTHLGVKRQAPKGAWVLGANDTAEGVYYIQEGVLEIMLNTQRGPEKVLYCVGKGCVFGEVVCFVPGATEEAVVKARTDCKLVFFNRETIESTIAQQFPHLLIELVKILGHIVRMYGIHLQDSLNLDFLTRVCRFLVYLVEFKAAEVQGRKRVVIQADITQSDMARLLGVHRVTITKAVKKLKELGILKSFTKKELEITDFPGLCKLSEGR